MPVWTYTEDSLSVNPNEPDNENESWKTSVAKFKLQRDAFATKLPVITLRNTSNASTVFQQKLVNVIPRW